MHVGLRLGRCGGTGNEGAEHEGQGHDDDCAKSGQGEPKGWNVEEQERGREAEADEVPGLRGGSAQPDHARCGSGILAPDRRRHRPQSRGGDRAR